jgi:hypothetical protein
MKRGQAVRPGDVVIASQLGQATDYTTGGGTSVPLHEFPFGRYFPCD